MSDAFEFSQTPQTRIIIVISFPFTLKINSQASQQFPCVLSLTIVSAYKSFLKLFGAKLT